jgi:hypothetical protein
LVYVDLIIPGGRCYDHNFLRLFFANFRRKKMAFFSKTNVMIIFFKNSSSFSKKAIF